MKSLKQFFSYMNEVDFPYVVLRNWDGLPHDVKLGEHSDLDLLVYDFKHWCEIFPDAKPEFEYPRVRMRVPVGDSCVYVDVRHYGDGYYPIDFERSIIETREWNEMGFYTPDPLHHRLALAYHAVHHKGKIAKDYYRFLGNTNIEELLEALKKSKIGWDVPSDKSVGSFNGYWKGATALVVKDGETVVKRQYGYMDYPLIKNEYDILSSSVSEHFPKVTEVKDESIHMEDCGVPVLDNLPSNWQEQLSKILEDLKKNNIVHRDIKLDNLMVKNGIIKLIDFGWAVKDGKDFEKEVPACLGFPNKPSWSFDDAYSMRRVVKQIDYELEERGVVV